MSKEESYIHLDGDYFLSSDRYQFILKVRKVNQETGSVYYRDEGFYPTIETLVRGLSDRKLYTLVERAKSLQEVQDRLIEWSAQFEARMREITGRPEYREPIPA